MALLSVLNRPIVNPFYHSRPDEFAKPSFEDSDSIDNHPDSAQTSDRASQKDGSQAGAAQSPVNIAAVDEDDQYGVQKAEATTLVWSKSAVWFAYGWYVAITNHHATS